MCIRDRSDTDDDRSGYNRRQETHDAPYTDDLDDQGQYQIEQTGDQYTATCIWKLLPVAHVCKDAGVQICDRLETTQKDVYKRQGDGYHCLEQHLL